MRRPLTILLLVTAISALPGVTMAASGIGPGKLGGAGWDCFLPPLDFNPNVHCAPPGQLEAIASGKARTGMFVAFATTDLEANSADFLGTERLIRADLYHGQPCPTEPPTYTYSSLYPRFGWDYYICHSFDSPW